MLEFQLEKAIAFSAPNGMVTDNINLCENHIIGEKCSEVFLPLHHKGCAPLVSASVSLAGMSHVKGQYEISRVEAPYHVILMTTGGRGKLSTRDDEIGLARGTCCILPAGCSYRYTLNSREWRFAWFHLLDRKRWQKLGAEKPRIAATKNEAEILAAVNLLTVEANSSSADSGRIINLQSELLLLLIDRLCGGAAETPPSPYEESLKELWHEVEQDLAYSWSVSLLARRIHVTPGHLHRLVRDLHGLSPMQMITKLRMRHARYLLQHTPLPIYHIAETVGYSDAFAFSTAYKRIEKVSPSSLRRRTRRTKSKSVH